MSLADGLPILPVSLLLLLHLTHNVLAIDECLKTTHWIKMKKENPSTSFSGGIHVALKN